MEMTKAMLDAIRRAEIVGQRVSRFSMREMDVVALAAEHGQEAQDPSKWAFVIWGVPVEIDETAPAFPALLTSLERTH